MSKAVHLSPAVIILLLWRDFQGKNNPSENWVPVKTTLFQSKPVWLASLVTVSKQLCEIFQQINEKKWKKFSQYAPILDPLRLKIIKTIFFSSNPPNMLEKSRVSPSSWAENLHFGLSAHRTCECHNFWFNHQIFKFNIQLRWPGSMLF